MTSLAIATNAAPMSTAPSVAAWSRIEERIWKGDAHFPTETPKLLRALDRARREGFDPSALRSIAWADEQGLSAGVESSLNFKVSERGRTVWCDVSQTKIGRWVLPTAEEMQHWTWTPVSALVGTA